MTGNDKGTNQN